MGTRRMGMMRVRSSAAGSALLLYIRHHAQWGLVCGGRVVIYPVDFKENGHIVDDVGSF